MATPALLEKLTFKLEFLQSQRARTVPNSFLYLFSSKKQSKFRFKFASGNWRSQESF